MNAESYSGEEVLARALALRKAPVEVWQAEQFRLLCSHIERAAELPFYSKLFRQCGFDSADLIGPDAFFSIPCTSRDDLDMYGEDFIPPVQLSDITFTSGITGRPVMVPYTFGDLQRLAFNEALCFAGAGIGRGSRVLLTVTLDRCFVAGLAYYSGLVKIGAEVIRSGAGQPARQWQVIMQLRPDVIVGVPSFLVRLATWGYENGIDVSDAGVEKLVIVGEPARRADFTPLPVCSLLEKRWRASVFSSYGSTEMETAFCECAAGRGGHLHPELMFVEVLDEKGMPLPAGEAGEVVVTPLGVEGMPLVRFRTGDVARLHLERCSCGWTTPRLGPVEGRLAHRLKFRGTTLYPESIFHALQEMRDIDMSYVEIRSSELSADCISDDVTVVVCGEGVDADVVSDMLQARLRVRPEVRIETREQVYGRIWQHGGRKPVRFFDMRNRLHEGSSDSIDQE